MSSVEKQLGGRVAHDWRPEGLSCLISIPLARALNTNGPEGIADFQGNGSRPIHPKMSAANTIMIVEDKSLVALSLQDFLSDLGYAVVGPFGRVTEALKELDRRPIDAAILDVNLAGEFVYPLAELLRKRNIPFVFATGYSAESIDPRFGEISVLQKPIDRQTLETYFSRRGVFSMSEPLAAEADIPARTVN